MMYLLGVLIVFVGVALSIALHEIGHLTPAKLFGVKVTQYMVGFGPTIWSRRRGETEYGIKAVPLGGYIRMIGMFPPKPGDDPNLVRASTTGRFSQLMDEARQVSMDEITPGDEHRVFYKLSVPKKLVVMLGGPTMNLLIAAALLGGIVTLFGVQVAKDGAVVASVSECVVPASQAASKTTCAATDAKTPAYAAGLRAGDQILTINGQKVVKTSDVGAVIRPRVGEPTAIVVERDGRQQTLTATPIRNQIQQVGPDGKPLVGADGKPVVIEAGFLGISSATPTAIERQPVSEVPVLLWDQFSRTAGVIINLPQRMVDVAQAAFGSGERDPNGPISVVGVGRVAGEVASTDTSGIEGGTMAKFMTLISLIAGLNMALFVFNLIPLLPLDGGHVAGALWEGLKRHAARLLKRPDPGYVDVAKALPVAYAVSSVLIVMSVLLIYADIVKPIRIGG